ncbi:hypothetical protein BD413DRAFT_516342 [Trametes elegans]|nr:hypothetical protein BD413DRAFT_516342 [Trametes elegans]
MFSFSSIAVFSTLALSAFTSALPLGAGIQAESETELKAGLNVPDLRRTEVPSLATIFADVHVELDLKLDALIHVTAENATVEALSPILADVTGILSGLVTDVQGLVGKDLTVILATVDGTAQLAVNDVVTLVGGLVQVVLSAVAAVLTVLNGNVPGALAQLIGTVVQLVASLLTVVVSLLGAVFTDLGALLGAALQTVFGLLNGLNLGGILGPLLSTANGLLGLVF